MFPKYYVKMLLKSPWTVSICRKRPSRQTENHKNAIRLEYYQKLCKYQIHKPCLSRHNSIGFPPCSQKYYTWISSWSALHTETEGKHWATISFLLLIGWGRCKNYLLFLDHKGMSKKKFKTNKTQPSSGCKWFRNQDVNPFRPGTEVRHTGQVHALLLTFFSKCLWSWPF